MKYADIDITKERFLLFDGICNLCNGSVKIIHAIDKRNKFKFASLQSDTGHLILEKFDINQDHFTSFVLIIDEACFFKSSAILILLKELGGFWKLFYILIILPIPVRDCVYDFIAKNRYKLFGKRSTCMIRDTDTNQKFLE